MANNDRRLQADVENYETARARRLRESDLSPEMQRILMEFIDLNKKYLELQREHERENSSDFDPDLPDVRNRADMKKHRNDVSRKVLADEEEKLAPKHSQPLQADTD